MLGRTAKDEEGAVLGAFWAEDIPVVYQLEAVDASYQDALRSEVEDDLIEVLWGKQKRPVDGADAACFLRVRGAARVDTGGGTCRVRLTLQVVRREEAGEELVFQDTIEGDSTFDPKAEGTPANNAVRDAVILALREGGAADGLLALAEDTDAARIQQKTRITVSEAPGLPAKERIVVIVDGVAEGELARTTTLAQEELEAHFEVTGDPSRTIWQGGYETLRTLRQGLRGDAPDTCIAWIRQMEPVAACRVAISGSAVQITLYDLAYNGDLGGCSPLPIVYQDACEGGSIEDALRNAVSGMMDDERVKTYLRLVGPASTYDGSGFIVDYPGQQALRAFLEGRSK